VVSARLDAIIRDPVDRTYLDAIDGYWADLVLGMFEFLEERGGTLDAVRFHFKGDYISYYGPWGKITFEFAPDNLPGGLMRAEATLRGSEATFDGDLDRLVAQRRAAPPESLGQALDREEIAKHVRAWADALRSATDLF
jgi:hypothetical protein